MGHRRRGHPAQRPAGRPPDGRRTSFFDAKATPGERLPRALYAGVRARHVHVSLSDICRDVFDDLGGVPVSTDLHDWDGADDFHQDFAYRSDLVFLSATALEDPVAAMRGILARGRARTVVCTRGAGGCLVLTRGGEVRAFPAAPLPAPVADSNGAGDAFVSGFLYGTLNGLPLERCVTLGGGRRGARLHGAGHPRVPDHRARPPGPRLSRHLSLGRALSLGRDLSVRRSPDSVECYAAGGRLGALADGEGQLAVLHRVARLARGRATGHPHQHGDQQREQHQHDHHSGQAAGEQAPARLGGPGAGRQRATAGQRALPGLMRRHLRRLTPRPREAPGRLGGRHGRRLPRPLEGPRRLAGRPLTRPTPPRTSARSLRSPQAAQRGAAPDAARPAPAAARSRTSRQAAPGTAPPGPERRKFPDVSAGGTAGRGPGRGTFPDVSAGGA
ncbi:PfkB family carbohydrate kinase [Nonomuraea ferruginea]